MNYEELCQQIELLRSQVAALLPRSAREPIGPPDLLEEKVKQFGIGLEALRIALEAQKQQNSSIQAALAVSQEQRQYYRELFEQAADSYLVTDLAGIIQQANRAACTFFNATEQSLVGKSLEVFVALPEQQLWRWQIARFSQVERVNNWEVRLMPDERESVDVGVSVAVIRNSQGEPSALSWLLRQLTEDKRNHWALRQQAERQRLVTNIAQRIRASLNLKEILHTTVAEVRQFLQTDRTIVYQFQSHGSGAVVVESVTGGWGMTILEPLGQTEIESLKQGEIIALEDINTAEPERQPLELAISFQVRGKLIVPILVEEQLWGLLIAHHCSQPRQWQQLEIGLLQQLALQVAIAIHQAELYERTQHQLQREQALNQVSQAIRSSLDLETIFSTAVNEIGKLMQVDRVTISQYLPQRQVWLTRAEYRQSSVVARVLGVEVPDANNPIAAQLKQLQVVKIDDTNICADAVNAEIAQTFPGAWLLVPLHFCEQAWGSLCVLADRHPHHWQDWEVELAGAVAAQLALAIQQAQIYQQLQQANQELQSLATKDGLTNVANRRCFDQCLEQEWRRLRREQAPLSLILCDIDSFKAYNDFYGHQRGDDCLRQVASAIARVLKRPADLLARYGGEEFVLILPNTEIDGAMHLAEEIRSQVKTLEIAHPNSQFVTLSLGVASTVPSYESSPATLIAAADRALYQAKKQGRDRAVAN